MKRKIIPVIAAFCVGAIVTFICSAYADGTEEALAESVIRLHVIANSDSDADQNLKLRVRDAILNETESLFAVTVDKTAARQKICESIGEIEKIARRTVAEYGCDYPVKVTLGNSDFPTKTYGGITLPAGTYEAVRVVIGDGGGKNWWCVLFPPLCLVDEANADVNGILRESLTDGEYALIAENENFPVKIKFKAYELWQESKLKIKNMLAADDKTKNLP